MASSVPWPPLPPDSHRLSPAWREEHGVHRQDGAGAAGEGTQLERGAPSPRPPLPQVFMHFTLNRHSTETNQTRINPGNRVSPASVIPN